MGRKSRARCSNTDVDVSGKTSAYGTEDAKSCREAERRGVCYSGFSRETEARGCGGTVCVYM